MRTATIAFDEEQVEFEVRVSPVPVASYFDVREKRDEARFSDRASIRALCEAFAPFAVSRNGEPVTADSLMQDDLNVIVSLTGHWVSEVTSLPLPLRRSSSDGDPSAEPPASTSP